MSEEREETFVQCDHRECWWPDVEALDMRCVLPEGHEPYDSDDEHQMEVE